MSLPRYYDDAVEFLRDFAGVARAHPDLGLHCARDFERLAEDLARADVLIELERRDLRRQLEDLENELRCWPPQQQT